MSKYSSKPPETKEHDNDLFDILIKTIQKTINYWFRNILQLESVQDITCMIIEYSNDIEQLSFSTKYISDGLLLHDKSSDGLKYITKTDESFNNDTWAINREPFEYALVHMTPIIDGIHCWRINVVNPKGGWMLFGVSLQNDIEFLAPSKKKSLYGISTVKYFAGEKKQYYGKNGKFNNINLTHFKQKKCEIDMHFDVNAGELKLCVVGILGNLDSNHEVKIWNIPSGKNEGWIPHLMIGKYESNAKISISRIPHLLYGQSNNNDDDNNNFNDINAYRSTAEDWNFSFVWE